MKLLKALTVCLILPFAFVACDKKSAEVADTDDGVKADSHETISAEYFGHMEKAIAGMGEIKDKASAEAYIAKAEEIEPMLAALMERAKAIPAPTDDQKAAIQATKNEIDERMAAIQEKLIKEQMANPPSPEAMAAKQEAMQVVMKKVMSGEFGDKMEALTEGIDAIYGLKD